MQNNFVIKTLKTYSVFPILTSFPIDLHTHELQPTRERNADPFSL